MESQVLLEALQAAPPSRWRDAALAVLTQSKVSFAGNRESRATSSARDLLQTYRLRLESVARHGIDAIGIEELLEALTRKPATAQIHGDPFIGPHDVLHTFWDEDDVLIGCVTVNNHDPSRGQRNLDLAMGKPT